MADRRFLYYTKLNQVLEDAAIDAAVNKYCAANKITGCGDIWDGFNQYVLINPGLGATITLNSPLPGQNSVKTLTFSAADLAVSPRRPHVQGDDVRSASAIRRHLEP